MDGTEAIVRRVRLFDGGDWQDRAHVGVPIVTSLVGAALLVGFGVIDAWEPALMYGVVCAVILVRHAFYYRSVRRTYEVVQPTREGVTLVRRDREELRIAAEEVREVRAVDRLVGSAWASKGMPTPFVQFHLVDGRVIDVRGPFAVDEESAARAVRAHLDQVRGEAGPGARDAVPRAVRELARRRGIE